MKILVVNAGSSSLKYQVIDGETEERLGKGLIDRIGFTGSGIKQECTDGRKFFCKKDLKKSY